MNKRQKKKQYKKMLIEYEKIKSIKIADAWIKWATDIGNAWANWSKNNESRT